MMPRIHYGARPPGLPKGDIEDCGDFGVWWYTQIVRGKDEKRWAYARRSACRSYWMTSSPVGGFATREAAMEAAQQATVHGGAR